MAIWDKLRKQLRCGLTPCLGNEWKKKIRTGREDEDRAGGAQWNDRDIRAVKEVPDNNNDVLLLEGEAAWEFHHSIQRQEGQEARYREEDGGTPQTFIKRKII